MATRMYANGASEDVFAIHPPLQTRMNAGGCLRLDFLFITKSFRLAIVGQAKCPESVSISDVQIGEATYALRALSSSASRNLARSSE